MWMPWVIVTAGGMIGLALLIGPGGCQYWFSALAQQSAMQTHSADAPLGDYAFQVNSENPGGVMQFIPPSQIISMWDKTATLGAWIWATQPVEIYLPNAQMVLFDEVNRNQYSLPQGKMVTLTTTPTFYKTTFSVSNKTARAWIILFPASIASAADVTVYYDGVTLVNEEFEGEPIFDDIFAKKGRWQGKPFVNLARNGSAETDGIRIQPWIQTMISASIFQRSSSVLQTLTDREASDWYYKAAISSLLQTFWGRMAASKVFFLATNFYTYLKYLLGALFAAAVVRLLRTIRRIYWHEILFFGTAIALGWGMALIRGAMEMTWYIIVIPWARYAAPVIIPTLLVLCAGWLEIFSFIEKIFKLEKGFCNYAFMAFLGALNLLGILSVMNYFQWKYNESYILLMAIAAIAFYFAVRDLLGKLGDLRHD